MLHHALILLATALFLSAAHDSTANPVTPPYTNDFTRDASDFWAPTGTGYNWGWDWRQQNLQSWVSAGNRTTTATMEADDLAAPNDFLLRVTVDPLTMSSTSQSLGLGACGSNRTLGTAYLADVKPRGNTVRLLRNTSPLVAERTVQNLDLSDLEPFDLELRGTHAAGTLTLTFTVSRGARSDTLTATDNNPLTGAHFGLRNRNTSGRYEAHFDDFTLRPTSLVDITTTPAVLAAVGAFYGYDVTTSADPPAPHTITPDTVPPWARWQGNSLIGTPGPTHTGPHQVSITTTTASSPPHTQTFTITVPAPDTPVISEFMADNRDTLRDGDGDSSDWIELFNPTATPIDVSRWSLTDDPLTPNKWPLPQETVLPPLGFLLVFASGKDQPGHANFAINDRAGGYLALHDHTGTPVHTIGNYPSQRQDISYGAHGDYTRQGYLPRPTPGTPNPTTAVTGFVADTKFSLDRAFLDAPTSTTITCNTPGSTIVHTTDGSPPTLTNGTATTPPSPDAPPQITVLLTQTTTLRAAAFKDTYAPSNIDTHTYLFLDDIRTQNRPSGWPRSSVNGQVFNYGMDPDVINRLAPGEFETAMTDIPALSLVTDLDNFAHPDTGFYVNPENRGTGWERPVSVELIHPDGSPGFQIDAGVRLRGGFSRQGSNPKHSFHLYFKKRYGDAKLEFPLFGDDGTGRFDRLDLRCAQGGGSAWHRGNGTNATFNRDVFGRHLQRDMGQPYSRSRYYHTYINGLYFGLFQSQERVDKFFAAEYFGGDPEDYDVMKTRTRPHRVEALDGTPDAWSRLFDAATAGFTSAAAYHAVQGLDPDGTPDPEGDNLVDVDNLIDYMLAIFYTGQTDGPVNLNANVPKNFFTLRPRDGRFGFRFFVHDNEDALSSASTNNTGNNSTGDRLTYFNPKWLHQQLAANPLYRQRFADRAHQHTAPGGALTPETTTANFLATASEITNAVIGESARWGDTTRGSPFLQSHWQAAVNRITNSFIPARTNTLRNQLRSRNLFPDTTAPALSRTGGQITAGTRVLLTADAGDQVFYTLDGSDPAAPGAIAYTPGGNETPQTLFPRESPGWRSLSSATPLGDSTQTTGWKSPTYDDTTWIPTTTPAGYGNAGTPAIATPLDPGPDPFNKFTTTYFRRTFDVADPSCLSTLTLHLRRDDGAIAYLNGHEIARNNLPDGTVTYNTFAEITQAGSAESTFHPSPADPALLVPGTNTLAIELHQATASDNDLVLDAELTASCLDGGGIPITANTTLKARSRDGAEWSPLTQATYYVTEPASADNIRITEIHYNPPGPEESGEFIELQNTSTQPIHLDGTHFTDGITYTFPPDTILQPGAYLLLAKTPSTFPQNLPLLGPYAGNLSNSGETLTLQSADNTLITTISYNDTLPWPQSPDGQGPSLTHTNGDPTNPQNWRPSTTDNGTPATTDTTPYEEGTNLITYALSSPPTFDPETNTLTNPRTPASDHATLIPQWSTDLETWHTTQFAYTGNNTWQFITPPEPVPQLSLRFTIQLRRPN